MDREEIFCTLAAAAMTTGRYITDRANRLTRELAAELTTPAVDDDRDDDTPRYFRTVLVVEVLTMESPYDEGLYGFGAELAAERLRAVILAESSVEVDDPWIYPSAQQLCAAAGATAEAPHEFFADPKTIGRLDGQCQLLASDPVHTRGRQRGGLCGGDSG